MKACVDTEGLVTGHVRGALQRLIDEEGLDNVFARHQRHAEATRACVNAWGLEILCQNPSEYSPALTAVVMPEGHSADTFRKIVLEHFNILPCCITLFSHCGDILTRLRAKYKHKKRPVLGRTGL